MEWVSDFALAWLLTSPIAARHDRDEETFEPLRLTGRCRAGCPNCRAHETQWRLQQQLKQAEWDRLLEKHT